VAPRFEAFETEENVEFGHSWCPSSSEVSPRRLLLPLVLMATLLVRLAGARSAAVTDPGALLDAVLKAYGGADKLQAVRGYKMEGSVEAKMRGSSAATTRLFARPGNLRVDLAYPDLTEIRVVKDGKGWRTSQNGIAEATGPMLDSMSLQAARAAIPWVLRDNRSKLKAAAPVTMDGKELEGLEVALGPTMILRAWVDPATHYVRRSQSVIASAQMNMEFSTIYSDYRSVDGVIFAFHEENFAGHTPTGSTAITTVTLNPVEAIEVPGSVRP
jgi:hypothetical protein